MKKQIIMILILLTSCCTCFAQSDIKLYVNNNFIACDVPPVIQNDRTLVPARALFEPLGATLLWHDDIKQAEINLNSKVIRLNINSNTAYVDNNPCTLDAPATIMNNRTMIPVRFVAENLGFTVNWDAADRAVLVSLPAPEPEPNVITGISSKTTDGKLAVTFAFTEPLEDYNVYPIDNPQRLVLDLTGCTYSDTKTIAVGSGGVQQIRMGNHADRFTLVLDLDKYLPYEFTLKKDKLSAVLTLTLSPDTATPSAGSKTVVIDAGHGGSDPGALGYKDGAVLLQEKDINLDIALQVADYLKAKGVDVLMTRSSDVALPLSGRYDFANDAGAGLFVSIHSNSYSDPTVSGSLTLYSQTKDDTYPDQKSSKEIAQIIQKKLSAALKTQDRGIRSEDELAVLRHTVMPAVLVEVIFVTCPEDQELILKKESRTIAAQAIAEGILEVLNEE